MLWPNILVGESSFQCLILGVKFVGHQKEKQWKFPIVVMFMIQSETYLEEYGQHVLMSELRNLRSFQGEQLSSVLLCNLTMSSLNKYFTFPCSLMVINKLSLNTSLNYFLKRNLTVINKGH